MVSIIVANFNKEKFISETIQSVLNQTHKNWELIIADDCSTDKSLEIIAKYLIDDRIKLITSQQNKGANFCRNIGISEASSKYIIFLDADDLLVPTCIENRLEKINQHPDGNLFAFSMGTFLKKIGDNKAMWIPISKQPLNDFLQHNLPWSILQPIWKKDFIVEIGGFDEKFDRLQDIELHTKALLHPSIRYYQFPEIADCYYRIDEERKIFNSFEFLERWMNAAVMYCNKFEALIPKISKRFLFGTIFKSHQQIIYHYKYRKINKQEYDALESILFSCSTYSQAGIIKKSILRLSYFYNINAIRIPGINKILSMLIVM